MPTLISTFEKEIHDDPGGLRAAQAIEELRRRFLRLITMPEERELEPAIEEIAALTRHTHPAPSDSKSTWRAWYGGQLQALLAMARSVLNAEVPLTLSAYVKSHQNVPPILLVLEDGECNLTDLGGRIGSFDKSYVQRVVLALEKKGLVETAKEGSERWVRLTLLGRRVIADLALRDAADTLMESRPVLKSRRRPVAPARNAERRHGERRREEEPA